jgi:uncharacterized Zn-binding protein involved in type VI secretion
MDLDTVKRYVIKLYDKSTSGAFVTRGEESGKHHGTPIAVLGTSIYCPVCKSEGRIVPWGPRRPMSFEGKEVALNNDYGMCKCKPTPRMLASQDSMSQSFTSEDLAALGYTPFGVPLLRHYDEGITLRDHRTKRPFANVQYRIRDGSEILVTGVTDASGKTGRIETSRAENLTIEIAR